MSHIAIDPLKKRLLGSSGLEVTRIGLGCAPIGGLFGDIPNEQAHAVVQRALSNGFNLFDTAPLYGSGKSEVRLGQALAKTPRNSYVLATKVGRILEPSDDPGRGEGVFANPNPFKSVFDFSYDGIMRSFEESLSRLGLDRVDILHIHDPDDHFEKVMKGAYPALEKLRNEGVISGVSAGMNQCEMLAQFARAGNFDCFLLAGRYSLLDQSALNELFPLCQEKNIGIIAGGTYNSGILAKGSGPGATYNYKEASPEIVRKAKGLEEAAARHQVSLKAAASQFVLAHPVVTTIVPGTRLPDRVTENLRLLSEVIPSDFWAELRSEGLIHEEAPVPTS